MSNKETLSRITPKGVSIWPKLNEPDTKFDAAGAYTCKLAFDADDADALELNAVAEQLRDRFFDQLVADLKASGKAGKAKQLTKVPFLKPEVDDETGDETGRLLLNSKMKASGVSKKTGKPWSMKPKFFSAKGATLNNPPRISGGSVLKLSVTLRPYHKADNNTVGVSAQLEAVQIIKLVSGGGRSFDQYGFGAEEGDDIDDATDATRDDPPFDTDGSSDDDDDDI